MYGSSGNYCVELPTASWKDAIGALKEFIRELASFILGKHLVYSGDDSDEEKKRSGEECPWAQLADSSRRYSGNYMYQTECSLKNKVLSFSGQGYSPVFWNSTTNGEWIANQIARCSGIANAFLIPILCSFVHNIICSKQITINYCLTDWSTASLGMFMRCAMNVYVFVARFQWECLLLLLASDPLRYCAISLLVWSRICRFLCTSDWHLLSTSFSNLELISTNVIKWSQNSHWIRL